MVGRGHTALGVLRSLALAGIPACAACPADDLAARSRWYRPTPGPQPWRGTLGTDGEDFLARMPVEGAVLIPAADDAALWVARLQPRLGNRFPASTSSPGTLEILQDKARFADWLAASDIPHPLSCRLDSAADIDGIPFDRIDKLFLKPVDSQKFSEATGTKGVWIDSREELATVWQKHAGRFAFIAQEYVPGSSADHYFVDGFRDRDGCLPGLFARRRRRIHPPGFGNSSYCESVPLEDVQGAVDAVSRLLERLDYRGIFSAEFKRDARDGTFRILEVNTRAWWYVEFAARCGVNVCGMAFRDAQGLPVEPPARAYKVGSGCVNLAGDLKAAWSRESMWRDPPHRVIVQWLRAHFLVFRFDDPRPGFATMRAIVTAFVRNRLFGRLRRDARP